MTRTLIHRSLTSLGDFLSHPLALVALAVFAGVWWLVEPESFDWHAVATLLTLAAAIVIERNQKRDTAALQLKLDELVLATGGARDEVAESELKAPDEMDRLREAR